MNKRRLKVGILAQYLNSRNDVRSLVTEIGKQCDIKLFIKAGDLDKATNYPFPNTIFYFESVRSKLMRFIFSTLYKIFGVLPKSKNNYYVTENFKIENSGYKKLNYYFERFLLALSRFTPKFIFYDSYLNMIREKSNSDIADIDVFFCLTQIYDDVLYADFIHSGKKVYTYVYSWDHPCKMKCFSKKDNVIYLVWSDAIKTDLIELQGIKEENIYLFGASQFIYLEQYLHQAKNYSSSDSKAPYIYITMSTGTRSLVLDEIKMLEFIVTEIWRVNKKVKFLIRPYPFLKDWSIYNTLKNTPNVELEEDYRESSSTMSVSEIQLFQKYSTIKGAELLIHCGTTLGLEASHLNIPVFFIDIAKALGYHNLDKFIHQYQNNKYLNIDNSHNVLKTIENLKNISECLVSKEKYLQYNVQCRKVAEPASLNKLSGELVNYFYQ